MAQGSLKWMHDAPPAIVKWQGLILSSDFVGLDVEVKGAVILAGWLCFVLGEIPDDPFIVARFTMSDPDQMARAWPVASRQFTKLENGNLTHEWFTKMREQAYARSARAKTAIGIRWAVRDAKRKQRLEDS